MTTNLNFELLYILIFRILKFFLSKKNRQIEVDLHNFERGFFSKFLSKLVETPGMTVLCIRSFLSLVTDKIPSKQKDS